MDKALGQFRLQVGVALSPFNIYGLDIYVGPTVKNIERLALQLHKRLNGSDVMIGGRLV